MKNYARTIAAVAAVSAVGLTSGVAVSAGAGAKAKKDTGTTYVSIVHQKGSTLYGAGYAFDKLHGEGAATYLTKATPGKTGTVNIKVKRVTEYFANGTLFGTASATQNLATGAVSNGKLHLTKGTGGQRGHSFVG